MFIPVTLQPLLLVLCDINPVNMFRLRVVFRMHVEFFYTRLPGTVLLTAVLPFVTVMRSFRSGQVTMVASNVATLFLTETNGNYNGVLQIRINI